jgi:hypothetical protein
MSTSLSGQDGQEGENTGVGPDRLERRVQGGSADGVEDDVEALSPGRGRHVFRRGGGPVVDRLRAEPPDDVQAVSGAVANTVAPRASAIWTATCPTPPAPPWTRTR